MCPCSIRYHDKLAVLIDTHPLPNIENGAICCIKMKDSDSEQSDRILQDAMAILLRKRIFASRREKMYSDYHQIDLLTIYDQNKEVSSNLDILDMPYWDINLTTEFQQVMSTAVKTSTPSKETLNKHQLEVLNAVMDKRDALIIWPTGKWRKLGPYVPFSTFCGVMVAYSFLIH